MNLQSLIDKNPQKTCPLYARTGFKQFTVPLEKPKLKMQTRKSQISELIRLSQSDVFNISRASAADILSLA